jgi:uncharacterized membrane protein YoaK (UPF0700 family)
VAAVSTPDAGDRPAEAPPGERSVLTVLLALTLLSGLVDAVCYLGLGHVFTANMTGNVVILGFAAAGAPGFSITASLTSLGLFLCGAVAGGRISKHLSRRSRILVLAVSLEAIFVAAAAIVAFAVASVSAGWPRYTTIAILAFAMGIRNAVIRRLAIHDMTTTVLTMTLTGLAADSFFGGWPRSSPCSRARLAARGCTSITAPDCRWRSRPERRR